MLSDLLKILSGAVERLENCSPETKEKRILGRTYVNGLTVSTVITEDMGPETAIIDKNGTHPVKRYTTNEEALVGHYSWVEQIKDGIRTVTKLGYGGIVDDTTITLVPREKSDD